jgi:hypothetical protein
MTERKITYALKKIAACKEEGYLLEALLKSYHLNVDLIKYLLSATDSGFSVKDRKLKAIVHAFMAQVDAQPELKALIHKKTLKSVKTWLRKMDDFFKKLKLEQPGHLKELLEESEKIFGILHISAVKLLLKHRPEAA